MLPKQLHFCRPTNDAAPDTLSALTRLTALILSHNYFGGLGEVEALSPAACSALTALRLLDLSDAGLERVPPAIQASFALGCMECV